MRRKLAFLICPELRDELYAMQSGNVKAVHEIEKLHDRIEALSRQPPQSSREDDGEH